MPSGYPFLQKNRKLERSNRDEEIAFLKRQLAVIGNSFGGNGRGMSFNTGFGEDGVFQKFNPTHMLNTNVGPRAVHEGEQVNIRPNGGLGVIPAEQVGGQQALQGMPGYAFGLNAPKAKDTGITALYPQGHPPEYFTGGTATGGAPIASPTTPSFSMPSTALPPRTNQSSGGSTLLGGNTSNGIIGAPAERSNDWTDLTSGTRPSVMLDTSNLGTPPQQGKQATATGVDPNAGFTLNTSNIGTAPVQAPAPVATGVKAEVGAPKYNSIGQQVGTWTKADIDRNRGIIPATPTPTPTPDKDYSPYVNRGLQRLERYAEGQDPFAAKIREEELGRFKGEESAARGALSQELAQAGISGREALTAQARQGRQIGAEQADVLSQLRKGEADRAFQAAGIIPEQALSAERLEETKRQFDTTQGNWEKAFGITQANQMATDAGTMTKETWLAKYGSTGVTDTDYDLAHSASQFGQTQWERNQGAFNSQIAAGNFTNAASTWAKMFPDMPLDLTKLETEEARKDFATGMSNVAAYIASGLSYEDALEAMKNDGTFDNLGLDEGQVKKMYDKMLLNSDPVYQTMSSLSDQSLKMMFPDMEPEDARALVGKMSIFGLMTVNENGQLTIDTEGLSQIFGEGFLGSNAATTASKFGVYDSDGKMLSPEFATEAEANTWKFNHPEINGLSVMTTDATGGTTPTSTPTPTPSGGEPTNSLLVADAIGELTGTKNTLLSQDGTLPFLNENGAADYTTALAYVKVDDGDKKTFAVSTPLDEDNIDYMKSIVSGNQPVFQLDKYEKMADEVSKFSSWIQNNYGKYIKIGDKYYVVGNLSHVGSSGVGPQGTDPTDTLTLYSLNDGKPITISYAVGTNQWAI